MHLAEPGGNFTIVQPSRLPPEERARLQVTPLTPTPETRTHTPETRTPTPETRNPTPETRTPTLETRTPTPETSTPRPEILTPTLEARGARQTTGAPPKPQPTKLLLRRSRRRRPVRPTPPLVCV